MKYRNGHVCTMDGPRVDDQGRIIIDGPRNRFSHARRRGRCRASSRQWTTPRFTFLAAKPIGSWADRVRIEDDYAWLR